MKMVLSSLADILPLVYVVALLLYPVVSFVTHHHYHPQQCALSGRRRTKSAMASIYDGYLAKILHPLVELHGNGEMRKLELSGELTKKEAVMTIGARSSKVTYTCSAYSSTKLRYIRCVEFTSSDAGKFDVFNFVVLPDTQYNLPILGIDLVSLPGGSLVSIDLQPVCSEHCQVGYYHQHNCDEYTKKFSRWQQSFPHGGSIPKNAEQFFSPSALWTRIPNNRNDEIMEPLMDYLNCYLKLVENALIDDDAVKADERRKWVDNYLQYRIDNDPARNMLEKSFGRNWTDNALANALFPTESIR